MDRNARLEVLQGVGGALVTPASLAILLASFRQADRGLAAGTWAGFSGVAGLRRRSSGAGCWRSGAGDGSS
jgi:hypothetical protein